ncbi:MAG: MqnA/MqnD/SBP family protein [Phycisphaerales bacterium]
MPTLTLAHSPDPDDAFMWWPLLALDGRSPAIDTGRFRFETTALDIELLNQRAERAEFDITAISCAQYARVQRRYALTGCGASVGDGYGPKLVARAPMALARLGEPDAVLAVPGTRTTAFMTASLLLGPGTFRHAVVPFDEIIRRVAAGEFTAGIVIHEGQLTFQESGLVLLRDLGAWWRERTGLPLPLGANAIKRDLDDRFGPGTVREVTETLARSVAHALGHRDASVRYALGFARDMDAATADRFVTMYVNHWTLDYGPRGRDAVRRLLAEAHAAGLGPAVDEVTFV